MQSPASELRPGLRESARGATLYVTHTYVRLFRYRRFCADDLDETLFAGSDENNGDAVHAQLGGDALRGRMKAEG